MNSPASPPGPRVPQQLRTQQSRDVSRIATAPEDSAVMVQTREGIRAVPKNQFASNVVNWDVSLSEQLAAPFVVGQPSQYRLTVSEDVFHHYGIANVGQQEAFAFVDGTLPSTGKYWLLLSAAVEDNNEVSYQFKDREDFCFLTISFKDRSVKIDSLVHAIDVERVHTLSNPRSFLLVCIDIDNAVVDVYDNEKQLNSFDFGVDAFSGAFIAIKSTTYRNLNNYGKVSTLATETPCDIPEGYRPLEVVRCRITPPFTNQYLRPNKWTRIGWRAVSPHNVYFSDGRDFITLPDAESVASLHSKNHFLEEQRFAKDVTFGDYRLKTSIQGSFFFGNNPNASELMLERPESGWIFAFGDNVWADLHHGNYTFLMGQDLGARLEYSNLTTVVGTGWSSLQLVNGVTALGHGNAQSVVTATRSVVVGNSNVNGNLTTTVGLTVVGDESFKPIDAIADAADNTVIGTGSVVGSIVGPDNVVVGNNALTANGEALSILNNVVIGSGALSNHIGDIDASVAIGREAGKGAGNLHSVVIVGEEAGRETIGSGSVAIGANALDNKDGFDLPNFDVTAIGYKAMQGQSGLRNSTALGANARVYGDDQVWLGDTSTKTFTHVPAAVRADQRDMSFVQRTPLGLDFILRVRPVQYRTNFRDRERDYESRPKPPAPIRERPVVPSIAPQDPSYQNELLLYRKDMELWQKEFEDYQVAYTAWSDAVRRWEAENSLEQIQVNPENADDQTHQGIVGQELAALAGELGIDFAGVQKLTSQTGDSVMCVSYEEFIPPLINAVQELTKEVRSEAFAERVAAKVLEMIRASRQ